jgi:ferredoxin/flavodoxin---NADP+ reductase
MDMADKQHPARILWMQRWSPRLLSFRLAREPGFRFVPGQFARLGLIQANGVPVWRAYSMASASWADYLEFYSIVVPDGAFTSCLEQLAVGDEVMIETQPFGFFTTNRFADGRDLWLLGTGTGLAPYMAILQDENTWQRFARLILVHCARTAEDLAYRSEIAALRDHPLWAEHGHKLIYQPVATREALPGALRARIPDLLRDGTLEAQLGIPLTLQDSRVMICGSPGMVHDTHKALLERGFRLSRLAAPAQIAVENAW